MKDSMTGLLLRARRAFDGFTTGQKVVAVVGSLALLLGGFLVFRWASEPSYAPLYSSLSPSDASAVVDKLQAEGTPYKLAAGGNTVLVPQDLVDDTRIQLSGEGLPTGSDGGYSLLDGQGLSTSDFQERTDFKRAMEGELAHTIEAIDGVEAAVVHLAIPEKQVFSDQQDPVTASVLVKTAPGASLTPEQVQAVVNLVASSIDGLDPDQVTVADSTGRVLSSPGGVAGADGSARNQMVDDMQEEYRQRLQSMLDRVVGPGNSTVQVSAELDFDHVVSDALKYTTDPSNPPLSSSKSTEKYAGAGGGGLGGVVGPDGQMDPAAGGTGSGKYRKTETTQDNAVGSLRERRETTPGSLKKLSVGVVLDSAATQQVSPQQVRKLVAATVGIDPTRGDTVDVTALPFDRTAEQSAAKELDAAAAAASSASRMRLYRNIGIGVAVLAMVLLMWIQGRRRSRKRHAETSYIVEQLRASRAPAAPLEMPPAAMALEQAETAHTDELRDELETLIERQPDDVAALLRGWLAERP